MNESSTRAERAGRVASALVRNLLPPHLLPAHQAALVGAYGIGRCIVPDSKKKLERRNAPVRAAIHLQRNSVAVIAPRWICGRLSSGRDLTMTSYKQLVEVYDYTADGRIGGEVQSWEGEDAFEKANAWLRKVIEVDKTHYWKLDPIVADEDLDRGADTSVGQYVTAYETQAIRNYAPFEDALCLDH